jgi:hypothetical protein
MAQNVLELEFLARHRRLVVDVDYRAVRRRVRLVQVQEQRILAGEAVRGQARGGKFVEGVAGAT